MLNMFQHIGVQAELVHSPDGLDRYSHLVLPGVGHFSEGASRLTSGGWRGPITEFVRSGKPLLGVCLGMQLLGVGSEEGPGDGLGLLPFHLRKLEAKPGTPVPHMGWNTVAAVGDSSKLLDVDADARFYFVHSFAVDPESPDARGLTQYGGPFASVVGRDNVSGVQFHPEKSHRYGMELLRNFAKVD
jgi:imidazole glycerol-phosphate synthase subunit HisH